jgi:bacterial/archaeal transporter family protein
MSTWIALSLGSAFFAGLVAIFGKLGVANISSNLATAIRTIIVVVLAWLVVARTGAMHDVAKIDLTALFILVLSGITTGASWLLFFRALQLGDATKVVTIDRLSIVLTIVAGILIFNEPAGTMQVIGIGLLALGTFLIVFQRSQSTSNGLKWIFFALAGAAFASITALLAKWGLENIDSNLATAIRTIVVVVMAWLIVLGTGEQRNLRSLHSRDVIFLILSGLATGISWLFFFAALSQGPVSGVIPIDKLSLVITAIASWLVFRERQSSRAIMGLAIVVIGTFLLVR